MCQAFVNQGELCKADPVQGRVSASPSEVKIFLGSERQAQKYGLGSDVTIVDQGSKPACSMRSHRTCEGGGI